MFLFPYAKINLGLNVVRKRIDGYHDIESVLVPIPLCDVLEAVVDPELPAGELVYTRSGTEIPGDVGDDLCSRAFALIKEKFEIPGIRLHLHKAIPMGAGLGGGSSDGTHTLLLLDRVLQLKLSTVELHSMASQLGSDCPFFLQRIAQHATGRGEHLSPIELDLRGLWLVLADPGVHVSTADVYTHTEPTGSDLNLAAILLSHPMEEWRERAPNVMESYVVSTRPKVAEALALIARSGAEHWAMSGSGSAVFGLYRSEPKTIQWPSGVRHWTFEMG